ncbi:MAG: DNA translocase FtsK [Candidatus Dojkabacteria bacterium]
MARRKKHVTYDSKETRTVLGLILLLVSLFFLVSIFTVSTEANIFTQTRNLFGQSTILTAFFLFSLGLYNLGSELPFTKPLSLFAQGVLVVLIPALITSFATGEFEIYRYSGDIDKILGGSVGYFIVTNVMQETIPTQPATRLILLLGTLIFIPVALSLSISQIIEYTLKGINAIRNFFSANVNDEDEEEEQEPEKAARFGDFNNLIKDKKNKDSSQQNSQEDAIPRRDRVNINKEKTAGELQFLEEKIDRETLTQETLNYSNWEFPPLDILENTKKSTGKEPTIERNAKIIEQTLESFGIDAKVEESDVGPSVVRYSLNIPLGTKVEKVSGLSANLALALGVDSKAVRIDTIPGTTYLGIEIPRSNREMVRFKELIESNAMRKKDLALPIPIGKDIDGSTVVADIQKMPHLLIAGATGSGKSVLTNSFISALLMEKTPDELRLILVDPKQVEFSDYNGIAHLLTPVITDMREVVDWLRYAVHVMEKRYGVLAKEQVRNIQGYNEKKGFPAMPYIVIVIDEMADMMMTGNKGETETQIVRLAQKARAVGIHLILATQRPSVNVITGIIKANIPGRIGMSVTSSTDSRVILDRMGAESLMGRGDLLYKAPDKTKSSRLQGGNIEQVEIADIVDNIKTQAPEVAYLTIKDIREYINDSSGVNGDSEDFGQGSNSSQGSLLEQSIRIAVQYQKGSSSFLQRKLNIGFNKAAQLVEELEELGVVGPQNGAKPRQVLISDAEEFIASMKAM